MSHRSILAGIALDMGRILDYNPVLLEFRSLVRVGFGLFGHLESLVVPPVGFGHRFSWIWIGIGIGWLCGWMLHASLS